MQPEKAKELLLVQVGLDSGCNRNSARLILADVQREHGRAAVDQLIRDLDLESAFDLKPGMYFFAPQP